MASKYLLATLGLVFVSSTTAKIPSYIHVCKRNDPELNKCVLNSVEALRPKLMEGIPELDIPPMEPLELVDLVTQHGGRMLKFYGSDFVVRGASNFEVLDLKLDLPNKLFQVKLRFPKMTVEAAYQVDGKILGLVLHGKGPVQVDAEDVEGNAVLRGKQVTKEGKQFFVLDSLDLKLNLKNYEMRLSKGFFKEQAVTDAVNVAVQENKREIINLVKPGVEEVVKNVLLDAANKITRHFTYDELFPKN